MEKIIDDEYDLLAQSDITYDRFADAAFDWMRKNLSREEYREAEAIIGTCFIDVDKFAFVQGFIRGIAAAKGGAL